MKRILLVLNRAGLTSAATTGSPEHAMPEASVAVFMSTRAGRMDAAARKVG